MVEESKLTIQNSQSQGEMMGLLALQLEAFRRQDGELLQRVNDKLSLIVGPTEDEEADVMAPSLEMLLEEQKRILLSPFRNLPEYQDRLQEVNDLVLTLLQDDTNR